MLLLDTAAHLKTRHLKGKQQQQHHQQQKQQRQNLKINACTFKATPTKSSSTTATATTKSQMQCMYLRIDSCSVEKIVADTKTNYYRNKLCSSDTITHVKFSLIQFSSRWYLCARKSPYALHPVSQKFTQRWL